MLTQQQNLKHQKERRTFTEISLKAFVKTTKVRARVLKLKGWCDILRVVSQWMS